MLGLCFIKEEPIFNLKNNWEKKTKFRCISRSTVKINKLRVNKNQKSNQQKLCSSTGVMMKKGRKKEERSVH